MEVYRCRVCGEVYIGRHKPASCPFCGAHPDYFVPASRWELLSSKSLSKISKENLGKALELELNNTNFYKAVSEKSKNVFIASMFKGLSKVEREHAWTICKHLKIEKPDSKQGLERLSDSDEKNMEEAGKGEQRAVKFYSQAMNQASEKGIKEFFKALTQIEGDHIKLIKGK